MSKVIALLVPLALVVCCGGQPASAKLPVSKAVYQRGQASWYGGKLHGRKTASGERFNKNALTAAHRRLAFGTRVEVRNLRNDRRVVVRINDRGPFGRRKRIIDVSKAAAVKLGMVRSGTAPVEIRLIRKGRKRR